MKKEKLEKRKKVVLSLFRHPQYKPMRMKEIAMVFDLPKGRRKELYPVLDALVEEGLAVVDRRGRYEAADRVAKKKKENTQIYVEGTFIGNSKGFGFVEVEGAQDDIYIPEEDTGQAMHLDKVKVQIEKAAGEGRRAQGKIVKILEHSVTEVVGTFEKSKKYGFVVPDNARYFRDIFIPQERINHARHGDKVVVQITHYGSKKKSPEGKVTEVLGSIHDPGVDILAVVKSYGIPSEFPNKVKNQAQKVPDQLLEGDFYGRVDLRDWTVVTIDGEDAKDLDDGVSLTWDEKGYHLGVHIADVTNYVQEGSALDREALKRGTSVYLADRVIPMLPTRLSNGICSLNQGEDRLALSCLMDLDLDGRVVHHRIAETVICVNERMTYTDVKKILEGSDEELLARYRGLVPMFQKMAEVSGKIRQARQKRGAIDFDFPECRILLNKVGRPVGIVPHESNVATRLIEDFMLLANETVAQTFSQMKLPFVYRTHERPDSEKMEALLTLLHGHGIPFQKAREQVSPKEIQKILKSIQGMPQEAQISRMILRSMKQAQYTTECTGHFGLAAQYYCHFTSPIRRYPDLQIHRIIKDYLRGRMDEKRKEHYQTILEDVARQSSVTERRADEAEREVEKMKKAEYMMYHIGEVFEGVISGVTAWGFYVELPDTIEGLVHVNSLRDDYYVYHAESQELEGEITHRRYTLGDSVLVKAADADPVTKTVDFILAGRTRQQRKEENEVEVGSYE